MTQMKSIAKIHAAATYFAFVSRDINAIAQALGVDTRTIRRWAKDEEWEIALGNVNYTGDRNFETQPYRDTERDAGDTFEKARTLYIEALNTGVPKHKRARLVAEATGLTPRRIRNWANRYGWAKEMKPNA